MHKADKLFATMAEIQKDGDKEAKAQMQRAVRSFGDAIAKINKELKERQAREANEALGELTDHFRSQGGKTKQRLKKS